MKRYKLRAEALVDVLNLMDRAEIVPLVIRFYRQGGCEMTLESDLSLADLRRECRRVPDGHVMADTVALD